MKSKEVKQNSPPVNEFIDLNEYFGNESIEKAAELFRELERPVIGGVDLNIPLNVLNNWNKNLEEKTQPRRKYSLTDYVWIKIIEKLRNIGLSFTTIKLLKENLFSDINLNGIITKLQKTKEYIESLDINPAQKKLLKQFLVSSDSTNINTESQFCILHVMIMESVLKKLPLNIAVFIDGSFIVIDKSKERIYSIEDKEKLQKETFVSVSISEILKNFLHSDISGFVIPQIGLLSYAENKLFEVVHSGDYEEILITFKDKKMKSLELKKSEDVKKRIVDILQNGDFGNIVIKKHNGIVTKIENTIKVIL